MPASDIQRLGLPCSDSAAAFYVADSGLVAIASTPQTVTGTIAANFDGTQPVVRQGWCMIEIAGLASSGTVGQIDVLISDGTITVNAMSIPVPVAAVANQGANYLIPIFATLSDTMVTIKTVSVIVAIGTSHAAGTIRVYFNGSN